MMIRRVAAVLLAVAFGLLGTAGTATAAPTPSVPLGDFHCC
jgi:hypothetical protein